VRSLSLTTLLAAAVALSACGADPAQPEQSQPAGSGAFPVTIGHRHGSTTLEAEPTRVVSVGFSDQDTVLALGVAPIGIREWYGEQPYATWPRAQEALGDAEPTVLGAAEIEFEKVAALKPT
jgi:iron complex transport system substrate-binding protein